MSAYVYLCGTILNVLDQLLPTARLKVLTLLLAETGTTFYLREIARTCGVPVRAVQREVARYETMGLCERLPRGKQVFFRVRRDHPLFLELRALLLKAAAVSATAGAAPAPQSRAEPIEESPAPRLAPPGRDGWRVW